MMGLSSRGRGPRRLVKSANLAYGQPMTAVRIAVLPVAGLGTRVLPGSKSVPKELLNVVDRPILSYIVAEARAAGIEHFVFVTGRGKDAIEDYFDHQIELEAAARGQGQDRPARADPAPNCPSPAR